MQDHLKARIVIRGFILATAYHIAFLIIINNVLMSAYTLASIGYNVSKSTELF